MTGARRGGAHEGGCKVEGGLAPSRSTNMPWLTMHQDLFNSNSCCCRS